MAELVSKTYSEALFDVALEMNVIDQMKSEFDFLADILKENPDFFELIKTPKISIDEKKKILTETFSDQLSEPFMNFLRIVLDKKRGAELLEIKKAYDGRVDDHHNVVSAIVESVVPLTEEQMVSLKGKLEQLSGKSVELRNITNKELVGGIIVTMGDRVIDGSIKYKLETMLEGLTQIII